MKEWLEVDRTAFLSEFLRLDGRGHLMNHVCACHESTLAEFRCTDCFFGQLFCQTCILKSHAGSPLHAIEVCDITLSEFALYIIYF